MITGVFRNFDRDVFFADFCLASQAGIRFQTPSLIKQIFFIVFSRLQRVKAFVDVAVTSRAGAGELAGMVDIDAVSDQSLS